MEEFGIKGYYLFFRTLEIMAREFDPEHPGVLKCKFRWFLNQFPRQIKSKTVTEFFKTTSKLCRIMASYEDGYITLNCPKLKDLCDEYTKKTLKELSGHTPDTNRESVGIASNYNSMSNKKEDKDKEGEVKERVALPLINFSFVTFKWENIGESDIKGWREAYPACNIDLELKRMGEWLKANPHKKKSRYRRFIMNWLNNNQDKGGTRGANVLFPKNDLEQKIQNDLRKR